MKCVTSAMWLAVGALLALPQAGNGAAAACDPTMACCARPPSPPGGGGSPCGSTQGVASAPSNSSVDVGAGNPINVINGNKYQVETDMPALPGVLGLEIVRHYNSAYSQPGMASGPLGRGWRLSYETELAVSDHTVTLTQADRRVITFNATGGPGAPLRASDPSQGTITRELAGSEQIFVWTWTGGADPGRQLRFDPRGKLIQIKASTGEVLQIRRDSRGQLAKVIDPQGRTLEFRVLKGDEAGAGNRFRGIQAIDSPLGRYAYDHGSALPPGSKINPGQLLAVLTAVTRPDKVRRIYHHEDPRYPTLLTGITVNAPAEQDGSAPSSQRISTWGYDAMGRANLSVKGEPARLVTGSDGKPLQPPQQVRGTGIEQVTLRWPDDAPPKDAATGPRAKTAAAFADIKRTVLTNSLGQETTYTHAVIAGEPRLLEIRGAGCATCAEPNVRHAYDKQGRLISTTKLDAQGMPVLSTLLELDDQGRVLQESAVRYVADKPQRPEWRTRYTYDEQTRSVTVRWSSVIAGRERTQRTEHNAQGRVVKVTETGFSPIDERNEPTLQGTPISRSTSYKYATINGRSVLAEVDGPLPNGPKGTPQDSDITRVSHDEQGDRIVSMIQPGGFSSSISYEVGTGRIARVQNDEGFATEFIYGAHGQTVSIRSTGPGWSMPQVQSFKYDALGHLTETGAGRETDSSYKPQNRLAFDALGRPIWAASALGVLQHHHYDTESRLIESGRYNNQMAQVQRYEYDSRGRITRVSDDNGTKLLLGYDDSGNARSVTDALGRVREFGQSAGQRLQPPRARSLRDDFGRVVVTVSPDSGVTVRRFDEADRLVASTDAQGNSAVYEHDAAGRIERQRIADKVTGQTTETAWRYAGRRLIALEHPTQSERYEHDARGLRVAKIVTLRRGDGSELTSVTRYVYDDSGTLQSVSLPDGSHVLYQRNGQGQVVSLQRSHIQTPWLRWLLPAQTVVKDIERDLVGPRSHLAGNGIEAQTLRSREGALARIVYRNTRRPLAREAVAPRALDLLGMASAHAAAPAAEAPADAPPDAGGAALPGALGMPADTQAFIDHRYLWDAQGNLLYTQGKAGNPTSNAYAYDARDRLIVATQAGHASHAKPIDTNRYHYDAAGRRVLSQEGVADAADYATNTRKALYREGTHRWLGDGQQARYDAGGQPSHIGQREFVWDATGRLIEVRQEDRTLARYRYSHRGERIGKAVGEQHTAYLYDDRQLTAELDARGRVTRQYVYLADQPIAVIDTPQGKELADEKLGTAARIARDLRIAAGAWFGSHEPMLWLHANHLGAIEAATDKDARVVWQARYAPFGAASVTHTGFKLNLRLPGQYADDETGLHYNDYRYYDPARGEYLSPDPLGTPDGPNPYAYVRSNPLKYVDPSGLVLFAFDGTGNTDDRDRLVRNGSSLSNVWQFRDLYRDGNRRYVAGVGTVHRDDRYGHINVPTLDMAFNRSGVARIDRMTQYFNDEADLADNNIAMDVDIIGFSRGASQARDFANQLVANTRDGWYRYEALTGRVDPNTLLPIKETRCQKVSFRFMGLWDTVLSTNSGRNYNLAIPDQFAYVAHAVALNEHRGDTLHAHGSIGAFPMESIAQGMFSPTPVAGRTRIERGFIGAHADIGGGFGVDENQLAQVALAWMVNQATAAGVRMSLPPTTIIASPVIHDKSDSILTGAPAARAEDREVRYRDGTTTRQRDMVFSQGMSFADTQRFINYLPADDARRADSGREQDFVTGTVNMSAYLQWLNDHGYGINMTVQ